MDDLSLAPTGDSEVGVREDAAATVQFYVTAACFSAACASAPGAVSRVGAVEPHGSVAIIDGSRSRSLRG